MVYIEKRIYLSSSSQSIKHVLTDLWLINIDIVIEEQKDVLDKTITEWMATVNQYGESHEQLDDILVMGVRV